MKVPLARASFACRDNYRHEVLSEASQVAIEASTDRSNISPRISLCYAVQSLQ